MGTYASLAGSFDDLTEEQLAKLRALVDDNGIAVEDDGTFQFSEECGYSFFSDTIDIFEKFGKAEKVMGRMSGKEEGGEITTYHFGTQDMVDSQYYFELQQINAQYQKNMAEIMERCTPADVARWVLEEAARTRK